MIKKCDRDKILKAIDNNPLSMLAAAKEAGIPKSTFYLKAKELGVYAPNQGGKGKKFSRGDGTTIPLEEILNGNFKSSNSDLKKILIEENILKNICSECGIGDEWMGERLVLELDHINGINYDNRIENLRILCPNCHSQTETYKNKNNKKKNVNDEELANYLKEEPSIRNALIRCGLNPKYTKNYDRARKLLENIKPL